MILSVCREERVKKITSSNERFNSLELQKIKDLIDIETIEYMSDNIKNILNINKENSSKCFTFEKRINKSGYRVVLYIRLSEEDGDLIDGDISKSIRNQLLLLLDESKKRNWKVVGIFCEEDISGADDNRPEWKKSLKFCECNRTEIMLCKSQSRFSRSMEMIEKYLHKEFVSWGIRFVGIVDSADTSVKGNKKARQINGLVNEWQVEEQSINTREILYNKKSLGLYATAWMPYGYIKKPNDKYQLIIDKEASIIVKDIFNDYINGMGCESIAEKLNKNKVPTTWEHMKAIGLKISNRNPIKVIRYQTEKDDTIQILADKFYLSPNDIIINNNITEESFIDNKITIENRILKEGTIITIRTKPLWKADSVRKILKNEVYTGYLVLGKYRNKSYKDKTRLKVPKEEWIRVPNCHEPIIDRDDWVKAKEKLLKNTCNERIIPKNIFAKKLYCSCCGRALQKGRDINENNYYLSCKTVNKIGNFCDNRKCITKKQLENILLDNINKLLNDYYDKKKIQQNYDELNDKDMGKKIENLKLKFNNVEYSISEKTNKLNQLYEDRIGGIITVDEFIMLKSNIDIEIVRLNNEKVEINNQISEYENNANKNETVELFEKYRTISEITPNILNEFIDKIYLGKYQKETNERDIKIIWSLDRKEEMV